MELLWLLEDYIILFYIFFELLQKGYMKAPVVPFLLCKMHSAPYNHIMPDGLYPVKYIFSIFLLFLGEMYLTEYIFGGIILVKRKAAETKLLRGDLNIP